MRSLSTKKLTPSLLILVAIIVIPLLALGGVFAYTKLRYSSVSSQNTGTNDTEANLPAVKQNTGKNEDTNNKNSGNSSKPSQINEDTSVILVDAIAYEGQIEVRAFMPSVVEEGSCTIIFKQGETVINKEVAAHADASSTVCVTPIISTSEFVSKGDWKVSVIYKSSKHSGTSGERTIKI